MYSPNVSRQNVPTSIRKSSQSKRTTTVLTPQRKATPLISRNRSLNVSELSSGIVGPDHMLSDYGTPVPVGVTEALTLLEKGGHASAKLDASGWVLLVCGRKLIIWNFRNVPHNKTGCCHELLLPTSSLPYQADLVSVFTSSDRQNVTSCMAVSPEGAARYWHNISLENSYTDLDISVHGESCTILVNLQPSDSGFIIGTSSSTLFHVIQSQGQLRYSVMKPGQGMLSGIGRRVSSLFFGSSVAQQQLSGGLPLYQILPGETLGPQSQALYILTGGNLQKWAISNDHERMLYDFCLDGLFREHLAQSVWQRASSALSRFTSWLMDIKLLSDGIMVLGAGVNHDSSSQVFYAIGSLNTEGYMMPQSFQSFMVTRFHSVFQNVDDSGHCYHLLLPNLSSKAVFLYNREGIVCVTDGKPEETPEMVDFKNLGGGCSEGFPLLISDQGQLVKIREPVTEYMASAADVLSKTVSFSKLDTSIAATASLDTISRMNESGDRALRLKAAFLASIRDATHQTQAQKIIDGLFPVAVTPSDDPGSLLDTLVVDLSQEMIDDYPASDPRWAESLPPGVASTSVSLILLHQLDDKLKAHDLFLCFLKNYGLWNRLTLTPTRDGVMLTRMILCEHAEKIEATKALRNLHTMHAELVDQAIALVLSKRQLVPFNNLTPQDLFYREVSKIAEILSCLIEVEEEHMNSAINLRDNCPFVSAVNAIIKEMIFAAVHYRQTRSASYHSNVPVNREPEFVPWTSSTGPRGVRSVIRKQYDISVDVGLHESQGNQEKAVISQQLVDLADMLLDGYRAQLDSLRQRNFASNQADSHYLELLRKFEQERTAVIAPFLIHHQYERATSLAEKYLDFTTLVKICDELDHPERLQLYMEKFQKQGFSDVVYQWHMNAGKRGKLIKSHYLSNPSLSRFLQSKENKFMSWLHDIAAKNYTQAHLTLLELGQDETQYLAKKKTLLSLSKLAALASVEKSDEIITNIDTINTEQDLILHQEQLLSTAEVQESLGVNDVSNMNVLTPSQIIDLYIGDYNVAANEFDFKKALDLMSYVDKTNSNVDWNGILLEIWSKAILRDRWNQPPSATDPIETCRETIFCKTLDLITSEDGNLEELLPSVDELLSSEILGELRKRSDFQCLLRAVYENVNRMVVDI